MYANLNQNITIGNDKNIVSKLRKMIEEGWQKLKSFVKSKKLSKFDIFQDLNQRFNEIADNIRNISFFQKEFQYFLFVKSKILYIIYQNCKDNTFGHSEFALELFDFFMKVWNVRINTKSPEEYGRFQEEFKQMQFEYKRQFYWNIYQYSDYFDEEEMYDFAERLKW